MERKFAFVGFGNVARTFARVLEDRREQLARDYSLEWRAVAIATGSHGCITSDSAIDLAEAARILERGGNLTQLPGARASSDAFEVIERCDADVLFETSPLHPIDGQPAIDHIRSALARRINVISANKGPVAYNYCALRNLADRFSVEYLFEGAVMDGAPIFNLVDRCLPGARVLGFEGVLNSTSNLILTLMEGGRAFEEALGEAQRIGVVESNPDYDIDGWDALLKARSLANVLMADESQVAEITRIGIRGITLEKLSQARQNNCCIRPVVRVDASAGRLEITVSPEQVPLDSLLGSARGTSNVLVLRTDLMGELAIFEKDPGLMQTAYALLSDLLHIHRTETSRRTFGT